MDSTGYDYVTDGGEQPRGLILRMYILKVNCCSGEHHVIVLCLKYFLKLLLLEVMFESFYFLPVADI